jgi:hypothetical protein
VNYTYWLGGSSIVQNNNLQFGYRTSNAVTLGFFNNDVDFTGVPNPTANEPFRLWDAVWDGTNQTIFLYGSNTVQRAQAASIASWPNGAIGGYAGGTSNFYSGNIGEIIFFKPALSTTSRQQIEGYLAWKWGLQTNLPPTHPVANNPSAILYTNIVIPLSKTMFITAANRWLPSQLSGLSLWLDAADRASITLVGTNVTNVNDKSGQNVILSNATGFSYATNLFNGSYPSFYNPNGGFTPRTTARLGVNASFAVTVPFTVFFVAQDITAGNDYGFIIDSGPSGTTNRPYIYRGDLDTRFGNSGNTQTARFPFQACAQFYNSPTMLVNGSSAYTLGSLTAFTTGGITIGNRFSLNEAWPGHICEIIIYNRSITAQERQQVEGYLAWKWGLRSSLPANHPNKNIPVS